MTELDQADRQHFIHLSFNFGLLKVGVSVWAYIHRVEVREHMYLVGHSLEVEGEGLPKRK